MPAKITLTPITLGSGHAPESVTTQRYIVGKDINGEWTAEPTNHLYWTDQAIAAVDVTHSMLYCGTEAERARCYRGLILDAVMPELAASLQELIAQ